MMSKEIGLLRAFNSYGLILWPWLIRVLSLEMGSRTKMSMLVFLITLVHCAYSLLNHYRKNESLKNTPPSP